MSLFDVVVAASSPDIQAEAIAAAVAGRPDMTLVAGRVLTIDESDSLLESLKAPFAVMLVGRDADTEDPAERYLVMFTECVVVRVTVPLGDVVRFAAHGVGLQTVLTELRELVNRAGERLQERTGDPRPDSPATGRS